MQYKEALDRLIRNIRLDFDPVGVRFIFDEAELTKLPISHTSKQRLSYCQFLAAARQERYAMIMEPKKCSCPNGAISFGFKAADKETDVKRHTKYFSDPELAWRAIQEKEKLELGACKGVYIAPLDWFDKTDLPPSILFMVCVPFQAYHILNDYMAAANRPNLTFLHTPNSSVCGGGVYSYKSNTANMNTMCAGSKTSGKTEMGYVNLFIPGGAIIPTVEYQLSRCAKGGASLIGKGSVPWPGLDACGGCPLFKFEEVKS